MIGPIPAAMPPLGMQLGPAANPAPADAQSVDNPTQPVGNRQPVELPVERVDMPSELEGSTTEERDATAKPPPTVEAMDLPETPNAGVTYRILKDLDNRIQTRLVDRTTREVLKSVPPDQLVEFYQRFRQTDSLVDMEA